MTWLRRMLSRLFRRRTTDWDAIDYGTSATSEDELARLNGER